MNEFQWHIAYTRHKREKKVARLLAKKGIRTYFPLNRLPIQYSNRKKIIADSLFASYIFVSLSEQQQSSVLQTNGVISFVYWHNKPAVMQNEEIAAINFFLQDHPQVILEKIDVSADEPAQVINEPLMMRKGNVVEISNAASKVLLPSLGYVLVADTRKENNGTFIYEEAQGKIINTGG